MAVTWLAGNRIRGTNAERGTGGIGTLAGGWVELGRTTLGSASSSITVSSLPDKRYYMVLCDITGQSASADPHIQLNEITTSTYAERVSDIGGTDATGISQTEARIGGHPAGTTGNFLMGYIANFNTKEKLMQFFEVGQNTAGAGNIPYRAEAVAKHAQTSNPVDAVKILTSTSPTWNTGTQLVILGWDPADTHTDNFWEELADTSWSSGGSFDTGAFTAKKYLWVQSYIKESTLSFTKLRLGSSGSLDSGSNYARRQSRNDNADDTATTVTEMQVEGTSRANRFSYHNFFIINNSANEKLVTGHSMTVATTGAGTAPEDRLEFAHKWTNTSAQCNIIGLIANAGNFTAGQIKVWGAD